MPNPRALQFALSAAFIVLAPGYAQLTGRDNAFLPRWMMYGTIGVDQLEVRFIARSRSGDPLPNPLPKGEGMRWGERIASEEDALALATKLCARLGPGIDLRMRVRRATADGWTVVHDESRNVCESTR